MAAGQGQSSGAGKCRNITLIGMPGAGKSTLGVVLAKKLGYSFVDTDLVLQEQTGKLLSEILTESGVEGFIRQENAMLAGLDYDHHIIATGGSAVYSEDGMRNLENISRIVYIRVSLDELRGRLNMNLLDRGVVIRHGSTLDDLYAERTPLYEAYADDTVTTTGLTTVESIARLYETLHIDSSTAEDDFHVGA